MKRVSELAGAFLLFFIFLVLFVQTDAADGQDPEYIFFKAAGFYEEGKYDEAIEQYRLLLDQKLESGPLYYNLGNCYLKKGKLGEAILNYERAKRLFPADPDLELNYQYAQTLIHSAPADDDPSWYNKMMDKLFGTTTIDELTISLSALYIVAVFILIMALFVAGIGRYSKIILSGLLLVFILVGIALSQRIMLLEKEAIVIQERVDVHFGPFERAQTHFFVYEGMKVQVILSKKDWVKVKYLNKKTGWIRTSSIAVI